MASVEIGRVVGVRHPGSNHAWIKEHCSSYYLWSNLELELVRNLENVYLV